MARDSIAHFDKRPVKRRLVNLMVEKERLPAMRSKWSLRSTGKVVGTASSCAFSPKYQASLLFAMVEANAAAPGTRLEPTLDGGRYTALVKDDRWQ